MAAVLQALLLALALALAAATSSASTQAEEPPPLPPVIWHAPFLSGGGYCSEAIGFVQALASVNATVQIEQHGDAVNGEFWDGLPEDIRQLLDRNSARGHASRRGSGGRPVDPSKAIAICHSEPGAWHPPRYQTTRCPPRGARYKIGRTMFETDRLPSGWEERLNKMDEVWVPTEFHRRIFADGGVLPEKLQVVGEPVDVDFFSPESPVLLTDATHRHPLLGMLSPAELKMTKTEGKQQQQHPYVFLSIFKWEDRKGWDVLLKAYLEEFRRGQDDVVLVLLTNAYHSSSDFETPIRELARAQFPSRIYPQDFPPVRVLSGLDSARLLHLYHAADAFVLPSRGEGWGRPHVEAMSMGLPIIATNWSGPTEFMTPDNAYPLRYEGLVEITAGAFKGHMYAQPSVSHLRELMRHVASHPEEARAKGQVARRDMVRRFSPEAMGQELVGHLRRIRDKLAAGAAATEKPKQEGKPSTRNEL